MNKICKEDQKIHPITGKVVNAGELEDMVMIDLRTGLVCDIGNYHPRNNEFYDLVPAKSTEI